MRSMSLRAKHMKIPEKTKKGTVAKVPAACPNLPMRRGSGCVVDNEWCCADLVRSRQS